MRFAFTTLPLLFVMILFLLSVDAAERSGRSRSNSPSRRRARSPARRPPPPQQPPQQQPPQQQPPQQQPPQDDDGWEKLPGLVQRH